MTRTPVNVRSGMLNLVLILANQVENGKALSRAMLHARREAAVLVPTRTKYCSLFSDGNLAVE